MKRNKTRMTERREDAVKRQEIRNSLSPREQLARLDTRLGKGVGATKERARLERATHQKPRRKKNRQR